MSTVVKIFLLRLLRIAHREKVWIVAEGHLLPRPKNNLKVSTRTLTWRLIIIDLNMKQLRSRATICRQEEEEGKLVIISSIWANKEGSAMVVPAVIHLHIIIIKTSSRLHIIRNSVKAGLLCQIPFHLPREVSMLKGRIWLKELIEQSLLKTIKELVSLPRFQTLDPLVSTPFPLINQHIKCFKVGHQLQTFIILKWPPEGRRIVHCEAGPQRSVRRPAGAIKRRIKMRKTTIIKYL